MSLEAADPPEEIDRLVELNEVEGPVGVMVATRLTVPLNPFWLARLIVELIDEPVGMVRELGLEEMLKSGV